MQKSRTLHSAPPHSTYGGGNLSPTHTMTSMANTSNLPSVAIGQTSVISMGELMRIRSQLTAAEAISRKEQILDDQQTNRLDLHLKSKERVKNWGNTLEAVRLKKEMKRQEKLDAEEARRQVQDREEAMFQAQKRRAAIEKAQQMLFEETDRVKTFNSKRSLCDAMKERELQEEIAREKRERQKREQELWHEKLLEKVRLQELEETRKEEEAMQRALAAKQIQTQQLNETKERILREMKEAKHEGELIRARAIADAEEEERVRTDAKLRARQKATSTLAEARRIATEKVEMEKLQALEEENTIQRITDLREEKTKQKEAKAKAIQQKKQDMRQKMIDRQYEYLMSLRSDEEKRLSDQIMKAELERAAAEAAKEARRQQAMAEGKAFNQAQLDLKKRMTEMSVKEGKVEAENLRMMFEEMKRRDAEEEMERRQRAIDLKITHKAQMEERARRKQQQEMKRQEESSCLKQQLEEDEAEFIDYANSTIQQFKSEGKSVKPLILQLGRTLKPPMISI